MEQVLKDYEEFLLGGHWAISSVRRYTSEARRFLFKTEKNPTTFSEKDVRKYLGGLSADGKNREYAASTRHRKLVQLRVFFDFLVQEEICSQNPCLKIPGESIPYKSKDIPSEQEIEQFFENLKSDTSLSGKKALALIALFYYLGLRVTEVAGLDV